MGMALKKRVHLQRGPEDDYLCARGVPPTARNRALVHDFVARHRARREAERADLYTFLDRNLHEALSDETPMDSCEVIRLGRDFVPVTAF